MKLNDNIRKKDDVSTGELWPCKSVLGFSNFINAWLLCCLCSLFSSIEMWSFNFLVILKVVWIVSILTCIILLTDEKYHVSRYGNGFGIYTRIITIFVIFKKNSRRSYGNEILAIYITMYIHLCNKLSVLCKCLLNA